MAQQAPSTIDWSQLPDQDQEPTPTGIDLSQLPDAAPEPPGALRRFLSAATESIRGLGTLATTAVSDPVGAAGMVGEAIIGPTRDHLAAATAARQRGDAGAWVSHMLRAVPIVGPLGEAIGEPLQEGDVATASGRVVDTAAGYLLPKGLSRVKAQKPTGPVPLLRSERTGSGVWQFVEHLGERTIPGATIFRRFRERQQTALQQEGERLASNLSHAVRGHTEVGTRVQHAIAQSLQDRKLAAGQLYDLIDNYVRTHTARVPVTREVPSKIVGPEGQPLTVPQRTLEKVDVGGVHVPTGVLKRVAIPMLRRIQRESQLLPPQELARTRALLERIVSAPKQVSFSAFQDARSDLLAIVRSHGDPLPGKAAGAAKLLADTADDAMMTAAQASGIPDLPILVREANALWREAKTIYNARFIERVVKDSPEAIPELIHKADIDDLKLLQQAIPAPVFASARARIMRDLLQAATEPPTPSAPLTLTGLSDAVGLTAPSPQLSGRKLNQALQRLGVEKATVLFGARGVEGLEEVAALAARVKPQDVNRVAGGLVAAGVNASILSPLLRPFGVELVSLGTTATVAGGIHVLSRVITRPEGLTAMRQFLRGLSGTNPRLAMTAGMRLAAIVAQDQQEANDLATATGTAAQTSAAGSQSAGPPR